MKYALLTLALALSIGLSDGCAKAPPDLSPEASAAFKAHQVVKALDVLRDVAIAANAQNPPLLTEATTRKVVLYHQSTVKVAQASAEGWKAIATTGLDEVLSNLPPGEERTLAPYVTLAKSVLREVAR